MKRKLGPLPVWAWVLIAGGTIGIIWYLRTPSSAAVSPTSIYDSSLPATAGPAQAVDTATGGGGGGGAVSPVPGAVTTTDDIWLQLMELQGDVAALSGGQGLTDPPPATTSWASQFAEVAAAITTVRDLENQLSGSKTAKERQADKKAAEKAKDKAAETAQGAKKKRTPAQMRADNPAMVDRVKKRILAEKKKPAAGSGGAGQAAQSDRKPLTNTTQQKAPARKRETSHQPKKATLKGGGNGQKKRTRTPR